MEHQKAACLERIVRHVHRNVIKIKAVRYGLPLNKLVNTERLQKTNNISLVELQLCAEIRSSSPTDS